MYEFLKLFFDICLFKKGPQDIPVSKSLLYILIPIYAGISFLILILSTDVVNSVLQIIVEVVLVLSATKVILFLAKKPYRFQQTASALIATDTIISFFAIPVMATLIGQGSVLAFIAIVFFNDLAWVNIWLYF